MANANDLDIWGSPIEGKHECFHCGEYYLVADSTASNEYRTTYCTKECQEKDTLQLKMAAEAEARFTNHENDNNSPVTSPTLTHTAQGTHEVKVGEFKLKVRND